MAKAVKIKSGKAARPSEVSGEMISFSGEVRISMMMALSQCVLDGKEMPDKWPNSVLVPNFREKEM